MILLLLNPSLLYHISGEIGDAIFLSLAIYFVGIISLYQDSRCRNALQKLKEFTQPNCKVIWDDKEVEIKFEELVVGDTLIVDEGELVARLQNLFLYKIKIRVC